MVFNENGSAIITVIVAGMVQQGQYLPGTDADCLAFLRQQLLLDEVVAQALTIRIPCPNRAAGAAIGDLNDGIDHVVHFIRIDEMRHAESAPHGALVLRELQGV